MEDRVDIKIKHGHRIINGVIWYEYSPDDSDILILHIEAEGIILSASANNCFSALTALRKDLEMMNAYPLVMGAHEKVYPSPMQLGMGDGRKAYFQRIGKPALMSDCVDIFDPCGVDDVSSIEAQQQYHNRWIAVAFERYRKQHL